MTEKEVDLKIINTEEEYSKVSDTRKSLKILKQLKLLYSWKLAWEQYNKNEPLYDNIPEVVRDYFTIHKVLKTRYHTDDEYLYKIVLSKDDKRDISWVGVPLDKGDNTLKAVESINDLCGWYLKPSTKEAFDSKVREMSNNLLSYIDEEGA